MRVLGPLAFGLYRTRHFADGTTLRPRTICCERVKATAPAAPLETVKHRHFVNK